MIYAKDLDTEGKKKFWTEVHDYVKDMSGFWDAECPESEISKPLDQYIKKFSIVSDMVYVKSKSNKCNYKTEYVRSKVNKFTKSLEKERNIFLEVPAHLDDCISSVQSLEQKWKMNDANDAECVNACKDEGSRIYLKTQELLNELKDIQKEVIIAGLKSSERFTLCQFHKELVLDELALSIRQNCEFDPFSLRVLEPYQTYKANITDYVAKGSQKATELTDVLMEMGLSELIFLLINNQHRDVLPNGRKGKGHTEDACDLLGIQYIHSQSRRNSAVIERFKGFVDLNKETFRGAGRGRVINYVSLLSELICCLHVAHPVIRTKFELQNLDSDERDALGRCRTEYSNYRKSIIYPIRDKIMLLSLRIEILCYALKFVEFVSLGLTKVECMDSDLFKLIAEDIRACGEEVRGFQFLETQDSLVHRRTAVYWIELMQSVVKALRSKEYDLYFQMRENFDSSTELGELKIAVAKIEQARQIGDEQVTVQDELPENLKLVLKGESAGLAQMRKTRKKIQSERKREYHEKRASMTDGVMEKTRKLDEIRANDKGALDSPYNNMSFGDGTMAGSSQMWHPQMAGSSQMGHPQMAGYSMAGSSQMWHPQMAGYSMGGSSQMGYPQMAGSSQICREGDAQVAAAAQFYQASYDPLWTGPSQSLNDASSEEALGQSLEPELQWNITL